MKVFLTGATGYVGSVIAEKLQARGHKVLGLARNEGIIGFFSINNQLSAEKARRELGWKPRANMTITDDIENGSYRNLK